jgi:alpha-2-macroglobulin
MFRFQGWADGANSLVLQTQDDALLYFDLSTQYYRLQASPQARGEIKVSRRYLDPKTNTVLATLNAGQLVKVELTIQVPKDVSYLALEDYLPGGLEALNEGLNASLEPSFDWIYGYEIFFWQDYGYNYKEIRGDRVVFFFTSLAKGKHTYTYLARAVTPGQFTALTRPGLRNV